MEELKFSFNWNNKLNCNAFSTIRLANEQKFQIGKIFQLKLKDEELGPVIVVAVNSFFLDKLTESMAYIDTGYNKEKCAKTIQAMYQTLNIDFTKQKLMFITLAKKV